MSAAQAQLPAGWVRQRQIAYSALVSDLHTLVDIAIAPNGYYGILFADDRERPGERLFYYLQIIDNNGEELTLVRIEERLYRDYLGTNMKVLADADGFYVLTGESLLTATKIGFDGMVVYRRPLTSSYMLYPYWLSAALGPGGKIHFVTTVYDQPSTSTYRLAYYQVERATGDQSRERVIATPEQGLGTGIFEPRLATDGQGNNYVLYNIRKHYSHEIKIFLTKFDVNGNVIYTREVDTWWYTRARAIQYSEGKVHLLWERLTEADPRIENIYYGQYDSSTGGVIISPTAAVADSRNVFGPEFSIDGEKVDIVYLRSSTPAFAPFIHRSEVFYTQISGRDGSVRVRPMLLNYYLREYAKAVDITFGYGGSVYIVFVSHGHDPAIEPMYSIIGTSSLPEITGPSVVQAGTRTTFTVNAPRNKGELYYVAGSLSATPGIPTPLGEIPLNPRDPLFPLPDPIIENRRNILDSNGQANIILNLPEGTPRGLMFFLAFITDDGNRLTSISAPKLITVQ